MKRSLGAKTLIYPPPAWLSVRRWSAELGSFGMHTVFYKMQPWIPIQVGEQETNHD